MDEPTGGESSRDAACAETLGYGRLEPRAHPLVGRWFLAMVVLHELVFVAFYASTFGLPHEVRTARFDSYLVAVADWWREKAVLVPAAVMLGVLAIGGAAQYPRRRKMLVVYCLLVALVIGVDLIGHAILVSASPIAFVVPGGGTGEVEYLWSSDQWFEYPAAFLPAFALAASVGLRLLRGKRPRI